MAETVVAPEAEEEEKAEPEKPAFPQLSNDQYQALSFDDKISWLDNRYAARKKNKTLPPYADANLFIDKQLLRFQNDYKNENPRLKPIIEKQWKGLSDLQGWLRREREKPEGLSNERFRKAINQYAYAASALDKERYDLLAKQGTYVGHALDIIAGDPEEVKKSKDVEGFFKGHLLQGAAEVVEGVGAAVGVGEDQKLFRDDVSPKEQRRLKAIDARNVLERGGIKGKDQQKLIDEVRTYISPFKDGEDFRIDPFGEIQVNPESYVRNTDEQLLEKLEKFNAPQGAKQRLTRKSAGGRSRFYDEKTDEWDNFTRYIPTKHYDDGSKRPWEEMVNDYLTKRENRSGFVKWFDASWRKMSSASLGIASGTATGILDAATSPYRWLGDDYVSEFTEDVSKITADTQAGQSKQIETLKMREKGVFSASFLSDVAGLIPDLVVSRGGGALAKSVLSLKKYNNLAQAYKRGDRSADAVKFNKFRKKVTYGAVAGAAGYSAASRIYNDARAQGYEEGDAGAIALRQFLITGLITLTGMKSGAERLAAKELFEGEAQKFFKDFIFKHVAREGVEEFSDEFISGIWNQRQLNPNMSFEDVIDGAIHAFFLGNAMGAVTNVGHQAMRVPPVKTAVEYLHEKIRPGKMREAQQALLDSEKQVGASFGEASDALGELAVDEETEAPDPSAPLAEALATPAPIYNLDTETNQWWYRDPATGDIVIDDLRDLTEEDFKRSVHGRLPKTEETEEGEATKEDWEPDYDELRYDDDKGVYWKLDRETGGAKILSEEERGSLSDEEIKAASMESISALEERAEEDAKEKRTPQPKAKLRPQTASDRIEFTPPGQKTPLNYTQEAIFGSHERSDQELTGKLSRENISFGKDPNGDTRVKVKGQWTDRVYDAKTKTFKEDNSKYKKGRKKGQDIAGFKSDVLFSKPEMDPDVDPKPSPERVNEVANKFVAPPGVVTTEEQREKRLKSLEKNHDVELATVLGQRNLNVDPDLDTDFEVSEDGKTVTVNPDKSSASEFRLQVLPKLALALKAAELSNAGVKLDRIKEVTDEDIPDLINRVIQGDEKAAETLNEILEEADQVAISEIKKYVESLADIRGGEKIPNRARKILNEQIRERFNREATESTPGIDLGTPAAIGLTGDKAKPFKPMRTLRGLVGFANDKWQGLLQRKAIKNIGQGRITIDSTPDERKGIGILENIEPGSVLRHDRSENTKDYYQVESSTALPNGGMRHTLRKIPGKPKPEAIESDTESQFGAVFDNANQRQELISLLREIRAGSKLGANKKKQNAIRKKIRTLVRGMVSARAGKEYGKSEVVFVVRDPEGSKKKGLVVESDHEIPDTKEDTYSWIHRERGSEDTVIYINEDAILDLMRAVATATNGKNQITDRSLAEDIGSFLASMAFEEVVHKHAIKVIKDSELVSAMGKWLEVAKEVPGLKNQLIQWLHYAEGGKSEDGETDQQIWERFVKLSESKKAEDQEAFEIWSIKVGHESLAGFVSLLRTGNTSLGAYQSLHHWFGEFVLKQPELAGQRTDDKQEGGVLAKIASLFERFAEIASRVTRYVNNFIHAHKALRQLPKEFENLVKRLDAALESEGVVAPDFHNIRNQTLKRATVDYDQTVDAVADDYSLKDTQDDIRKITQRLALRFGISPGSIAITTWNEREERVEVVVRPELKRNIEAEELAELEEALEVINDSGRPGLIVQNAIKLQDYQFVLSRMGVQGAEEIPGADPLGPRTRNIPGGNIIGQTEAETQAIIESTQELVKENIERVLMGISVDDPPGYSEEGPLLVDDPIDVFDEAGKKRKLLTRKSEERELSRLEEALKDEEFDSDARLKMEADRDALLARKALRESRKRTTQRPGLLTRASQLLDRVRLEAFQRENSAAIKENPITRVKPENYPGPGKTLEKDLSLAIQALDIAEQQVETARSEAVRAEIVGVRGAFGVKLPGESEKLFSQKAKELSKAEAKRDAEAERVDKVHRRFLDFKREALGLKRVTDRRFINTTGEEINVGIPELGIEMKIDPNGLSPSARKIFDVQDDGSDPWILQEYRRHKNIIRKKTAKLKAEEKLTKEEEDYIPSEVIRLLESGGLAIYNQDDSDFLENFKPEWSTGSRLSPKGIFVPMGYVPVEAMLKGRALEQHISNTQFGRDFQTEELGRQNQNAAMSRVRQRYPGADAGSSRFSNISEMLEAYAEESENAGIFGRSNIFEDSFDNNTGELTKGVFTQIAEAIVEESTPAGEMAEDPAIGRVKEQLRREFEEGYRVLNSVERLQQVSNEMYFAILGGRPPQRLLDKAESRRRDKEQRSGQISNLVNLQRTGHLGRVPFNLSRIAKTPLGSLTFSEGAVGGISDAEVAEDEPFLKKLEEITIAINNFEPGTAEHDNALKELQDPDLERKMDRKSIRVAFSDGAGSKFAFRFEEGLPEELMLDYAEKLDSGEWGLAVAKHLVEGKKVAAALLGVDVSLYSEKMKTSGSRPDRDYVRTLIRRAIYNRTIALNRDLLNSFLLSDELVDNGVLAHGGFSVYQKQRIVSITGGGTTTRTVLQWDDALFELPKTRPNLSSETGGLAKDQALMRLIGSGFLQRSLLEIASKLEIMEHGTNRHNKAIMHYASGLTPAGYAYKLVADPFVVFLARIKGTTVPVQGGKMDALEFMVKAFKDHGATETDIMRLRALFDKLPKGIETAPEFQDNRSAEDIYYEWADLERAVNAANSVRDITITELKQNRAAKQLKLASEGIDTDREGDLGQEHVVDWVAGMRMARRAGWLADQAEKKQEIADREGDPSSLGKEVVRKAALLSTIKTDTASSLLRLQSYFHTERDKVRIIERGEDETPFVIKDTETGEETASAMALEEAELWEIEGLLKKDKDFKKRLAGFRMIALLALNGYDLGKVRKIVNSPEFSRETIYENGSISREYHTDKLDKYITLELEKALQEEKDNGHVVMIQPKFNGDATDLVADIDFSKVDWDAPVEAAQQDDSKVSWEKGAVDEQLRSLFIKYGVDKVDDDKFKIPEEYDRWIERITEMPDDQAIATLEDEVRQRNFPLNWVMHEGRYIRLTKQEKAGADIVMSEDRKAYTPTEYRGFLMNSIIKADVKLNPVGQALTSILNTGGEAIGTGILNLNLAEKLDGPTQQHHASYESLIHTLSIEIPNLTVIRGLAHYDNHELPGLAFVASTQSPILVYPHSHSSAASDNETLHQVAVQMLQYLAENGEVDLKGIATDMVAPFKDLNPNSMKAKVRIRKMVEKDLTRHAVENLPRSMWIGKDSKSPYALKGEEQDELDRIADKRAPLLQEIGDLDEEITQLVRTHSGDIVHTTDPEKESKAKRDKYKALVAQRRALQNKANKLSDELREKLFKFAERAKGSTLTEEEAEALIPDTFSDGFQLTVNRRINEIWDGVLERVSQERDRFDQANRVALAGHLDLSDPAGVDRLVGQIQGSDRMAAEVITTILNSTHLKRLLAYASINREALTDPFSSLWSAPALGGLVPHDLMDYEEDIWVPEYVEESIQNGNASNINPDGNTFLDEELKQFSDLQAGPVTETRPDGSTVLRGVKAAGTHMGLHAALPSGMDGLKDLMVGAMDRLSPNFKNQPQGLILEKRDKELTLFEAKQALSLLTPEGLARLAKTHDSQVPREERLNIAEAVDGVITVQDLQNLNNMQANVVRHFYNELTRVYKDNSVAKQVARYGSASASDHLFGDPRRRHMRQNSLDRGMLGALLAIMDHLGIEAEPKEAARGVEITNWDISGITAKGLTRILNQIGLPSTLSKRKFDKKTGEYTEVETLADIEQKKIDDENDRNTTLTVDLERKIGFMRDDLRELRSLRDQLEKGHWGWVDDEAVDATSATEFIKKIKDTRFYEATSDNAVMQGLLQSVVENFFGTTDTLISAVAKHLVEEDISAEAGARAPFEDGTYEIDLAALTEKEERSPEFAESRRKIESQLEALNKLYEGKGRNFANMQGRLLDQFKKIDALKAEGTPESLSQAKNIEGALLNISNTYHDWMKETGDLIDSLFGRGVLDRVGGMVPGHLAEQRVTGTTQRVVPGVALSSKMDELRAELSNGIWSKKLTRFKSAATQFLKPRLIVGKIHESMVNKALKGLAGGPISQDILESVGLAGWGEGFDHEAGSRFSKGKPGFNIPSNFGKGQTLKSILKETRKLEKEERISQIFRKIKPHFDIRMDKIAGRLDSAASNELQNAENELIVLEAELRDHVREQERELMAPAHNTVVSFIGPQEHRVELLGNEDEVALVRGVLTQIARGKNSEFFDIYGKLDTIDDLERNTEAHLLSDDRNIAKTQIKDRLEQINGQAYRLVDDWLIPESVAREEGERIVRRKGQSLTEKNIDEALREFVLSSPTSAAGLANGDVEDATQLIDLGDLADIEATAGFKPDDQDGYKEWNAKHDDHSVEVIDALGEKGILVYPEWKDTKEEEFAKGLFGKNDLLAAIKKMHVDMYSYLHKIHSIMETDSAGGLDMLGEDEVSRAEMAKIKKELGDFLYRTNGLHRNDSNELHVPDPKDKTGAYMEVSRRDAAKFFQIYTNTKAVMMAYRHSKWLQYGVVNTQLITNTEGPHNFQYAMHHDAKVRMTFAKHIAAQEIVQGLTSIIDLGPLTAQEFSFGRNGHAAMIDWVKDSFVKNAPKRGAKSDVEAASLGYIYQAIDDYLYSQAPGTIKEKAQLLLGMFTQSDTVLNEISDRRKFKALSVKNLLHAIKAAKEVKDWAKAAVLESEHRLIKEAGLYKMVRDVFVPALEKITEMGDPDSEQAGIILDDALKGVTASGALTALPFIKPKQLAEDAKKYAEHLENLFGVMAKLYQAQGQLIPEYEYPHDPNSFKNRWVDQGNAYLSNTDKISGRGDKARVVFRHEKTLKGHQTEEQRGRSSDTADLISMRGASWLKQPRPQYDDQIEQVIDVNGVSAPFTILNDMIYRMNVAPAFAVAQALVGDYNRGEKAGTQVHKDRNTQDERSGIIGRFYSPPPNSDNVQDVENKKKMRDAGQSISVLLKDLIEKDLQSIAPSSVVQEASDYLGSMGVALMLAAPEQLWKQSLWPVLAHSWFHPGHNETFSIFMQLLGSKGRKYISNAANFGGVIDKLGIPHIAPTLDGNADRALADFVKKNAIKIYERNADGQVHFHELMLGADPRVQNIISQTFEEGSILGYGERALHYAAGATVKPVSRLSRKAWEWSTRMTVAKAEKAAVYSVFISEVARLVNEKISQLPTGRREEFLAKIGKPDGEATWLDILGLTPKAETSAFFEEGVLSKSVIYQGVLAATTYLGEADIGKKGALFQRKEGITPEMARGLFSVFANHTTSTAGNGLAGFNMAQQGISAKTRSVGRRLPAQAITQNLLFVGLDYKMKVAAVGAIIYAISRGLGDDDDEAKRKSREFQLHATGNREGFWGGVGQGAQFFGGGGGRPMGYSRFHEDWTPEQRAKDYGFKGVDVAKELFVQSGGGLARTIVSRKGHKAPGKVALFETLKMFGATGLGSSTYTEGLKLGYGTYLGDPSALYYADRMGIAPWQQAETDEDAGFLEKGLTGGLRMAGSMTGLVENNNAALYSLAGLWNITGRPAMHVLNSESVSAEGLMYQGLSMFPGIFRGQRYKFSKKAQEVDNVQIYKWGRSSKEEKPWRPPLRIR